MNRMKTLLATLFFILAFTWTSFGQSKTEKTTIAVEQGEQIWNATSPDKSFLSEGSTMEYGLGYLKDGNYSSASWSFNDLLKKNKENAFANFFMGCVSLGLDDLEAAQKFFDHAVQLNAELKSSVPELTLSQIVPPAPKIEGPQPTTQAPNNAPKPIDVTPTTPNQAVNQYKVGDQVEVTYAGGWWPGVVTKLEGRDKSVYLSVEFLFQNVNRSGNYYYNGVRPVSGQTTTFTPPSIAGGPLVYGEYVLTLGLGISPTKKGFFKLSPNGNYSYNGVKGKYTYNPETGNITWKSGTFQNWGKNTSSFIRGTRVAQIDMTYTTESGTLYYSAGRNLN